MNNTPSKIGQQDGKKKMLPALIRFTLHASERDWLKSNADAVDMSVVAYIKTKIVGSHYDPNVRAVLLRLNRDLTLYGHTLNHIRDSLNRKIATGDQAETMLQDIRNPLIETLQTIKRFLAQGIMFP